MPTLNRRHIELHTALIMLMFKIKILITIIHRSTGATVPLTVILSYVFKGGKTRQIFYM